MKIELSVADANRLLALVRSRKRQCHHGLTKFGDAFDPVKGIHMQRGFDNYSALEQSLKEAIDADNSRGAGRNSAQHEARDG